MAEADAPAHSQHVYRTRALGSIAELVTDAGALFAASEMLELELERIDLVASRFRSDSELSRLNAAAGSEVVVGHDLFEAIDVALAMAEATDGLVDPTVGEAMNRLGYDRDFADVVGGVDGELPPAASRAWVALRRPSTGADAPSRLPADTSLDLGATAKALAADRAAATIHSRLGCGVLVSLGGDASAAGPAPAGGFDIGIADTCTSPIPPRQSPSRRAGSPPRASASATGDWEYTRSITLWTRPPGCLRRPAGGPSRRRQRPACRRTRRPRPRWCWGSAPSTGWRTTGFRRGSCGSTGPSSTPKAGRSQGRSRRAGVEQPMTPIMLATVGHGSTALWYLTRATGLVSLILLSATVVLGTVASVGWTSDRWPRFLSQSLHRNLSLFCIALIGVHVVTTVGDGYVPIGLADAVIPFRSPYRPIWVGLGAVAFDMLLAVAITSALRRRIGVAAWRGVHWLAYACWPIAVVHGLGSGSDPRLPGAMLVFVLCIAAVAAALAWRLAAGRARSVTWRLGGAVAGAAALMVITAFAAAGPLRPGWSHRAGTSSALLAQLSGSTSASYSSAPPSSTTLHLRPARLGHPDRPLRDDRVGNGRHLTAQW